MSEILRKTGRDLTTGEPVDINIAVDTLSDGRKAEVLKIGAVGDGVSLGGGSIKATWATDTAAPGGDNIATNFGVGDLAIGNCSVDDSTLLSGTLYLCSNASGTNTWIPIGTVKTTSDGSKAENVTGEVVSSISGAFQSHATQTTSGTSSALTGAVAAAAASATSVLVQPQVATESVFVSFENAASTTNGIRVTGDGLIFKGVVTDLRIIEGTPAGAEVVNLTYFL